MGFGRAATRLVNEVKGIDAAGYDRVGMRGADA